MSLPTLIHFTLHLADQPLSFCWFSLDFQAIPFLFFKKMLAFCLKIIELFIDIIIFPFLLFKKPLHIFFGDSFALGFFLKLANSPPKSFYLIFNALWLIINKRVDFRSDVIDAFDILPNFRIAWIRSISIADRIFDDIRLIKLLKVLLFLHLSLTISPIWLRWFFSLAFLLFLR